MPFREVVWHVTGCLKSFVGSRDFQDRGGLTASIIFRLSVVIKNLQTHDAATAHLIDRSPTTL